MYRTITVENLRGFRSLAVDGLRQINLIVGQNNVGKTGLLEAIWLLNRPGDPSALALLNEWRGIATARRAVDPDVVFYLFRDLYAERGLSVRGLWRDRERDFRFRLFAPGADDVPGQLVLNADSYRLQDESLLLSESVGGELTWTGASREPQTIRVRDVTTLLRESRFLANRQTEIPVSGRRAIFIPTRSRVPYIEEAERFRGIVQRGERRQLISALRVIDTRIVDIELLPLAGETVLHVDIGFNRFIPIGLFGEGSQRLVSLVLGLAEASGGQILVDEIDTGLHYSVLPKMWELVHRAATEFGVQVFATTHSFECMAAAHEAFTPDPEALAVHRLERDDEEVGCVSFDHRLLGLAINSRSEVR